MPRRQKTLNVIESSLNIGIQSCFERILRDRRLLGRSNCLARILLGVVKPTHNDFAFGAPANVF